MNELFDLYFWDRTYANPTYRIQSLTETEVNDCLKHIFAHHKNYDYGVILSGYLPWSQPVMLVDKTADWISTNKSMTVFDFNAED